MNVKKSVRKEMKADLYKLAEGYELIPAEGNIAKLVGHTREQAILYAVVRGCTEITEWRDGKQFCTISIPKKTE
jgi:hypothetical protein